MPLILGREQLRDWLEKPEQTEELLHSVPSELEKRPIDRQMLHTPEILWTACAAVLRPSF